MGAETSACTDERLSPGIQTGWCAWEGSLTAYVIHKTIQANRARRHASKSTIGPRLTSCRSAGVNPNLVPASNHHRYGLCGHSHPFSQSMKRIVQCRFAQLWMPSANLGRLFLHPMFRFGYHHIHYRLMLSRCIHRSGMPRPFGKVGGERRVLGIMG